MFQRSFAGMFLLAGMGFLSGCGGKPPDDKKPSSPVAETQDIKLEAVSPAEFRKAIDAQKGKVILIDFWGSY